MNLFTLMRKACLKPLHYDLQKHDTIIDAKISSEISLSKRFLPLAFVSIIFPFSHITMSSDAL